MTARTCPDWPELMELAPDLQFKHYSVAEAQLPAEVLASVTHVSLGDVEICCDLEKHVVNPGHTDAEVVAALREFGTFGVVESVKAVSDLYAPISGEVVEVNDALRESHWFDVNEWATSGPGTEVGQVDIDVPLRDADVSDAA